MSDGNIQFLTFSQALDEIKKGRKARRIAWKGRPKFVHFRTFIDPNDMSYLELVYQDDNSRAPWSVTRCDLLENDWVLCKE